MKCTILPECQLLEVIFEASNEQITAEAGAMVTMDPALRMVTRASGGLIAAARRKASFVQNSFTATAADQKLLLAPPLEGTIEAIELAKGESLYLNSATYLAHTGVSRLDVKRKGARDFFDGSSLLLHIEGPSTVYLFGNGAIQSVALTQKMVVEPERLAAFSGDVEPTHRPFPGYRGIQFPLRTRMLHLAGDGGTVWLQTRDPSVLAAFVRPYQIAEPHDD